MTDNAAPQQPKPADLTAADAKALQFNAELRTMLKELTGWSVWHSDTGVLHATRITELTDAEMKQGLSRTLEGAGPQHLLERIHHEVRAAAIVAQGGTVDHSRFTAVHA